MSVQYKNVTFSYNKIENVISEIEFSLEKGKIYGLLGHNGAGKTTLFRLTTGLLQPDKGKINLYKEDTISYMPYNNALYNDLTIYHNIKFRSECYLQSQNDFNKNYQEYIKKFNIEDITQKKVKELSTGLKKRVSLICSCIAQTDLLILDEPTNGVDPETLIIMTQFLKELNEKGTTIAVSSHNLDFISKIADEILILANGELVYSNSMSNIKDLDSIYLKHCKGSVSN